MKLLTLFFMITLSPSSSLAQSVYQGIKSKFNVSLDPNLFSEITFELYGQGYPKIGKIETYYYMKWLSGQTGVFGGPEDLSITNFSASILTGEKLVNLNNPLDPMAEQLQQNLPLYYYATVRAGKNWPEFYSLVSNRLVVVNPSNNKAVIVRIVDWGPHIVTQNILQLSPQALKDLNLDQGDKTLVAFADRKTPLGVINFSTKIDPTYGNICSHSMGGDFVSGGCSSSKQCINGQWKNITEQLFDCVCSDNSGAIGCGIE